MSRPRPTIRHLLLGLTALTVAVPLLTLLFLPVFDAYLLRQTERLLIAESVVIGEAWRDRWLEASGVPQDASPQFRPPGQEEDSFTPFAAVLDLDYDVLEPRDEPEQPRVPLDPAKARAGQAIAPLLERAQRFNLSGVRVLDERGCVLAASRGPTGYCLRERSEVVGALEGRYAAVVRRRISDEPTPPITSIRRRGKLRVFTAIPIFSDGRVVAVVRMSRTAVSPTEALYTHRGKVALVALLFLVVTPTLTYLLAHAISRPLRALRAGAESAARGGRLTPLEVGRLTPRELVALSDSIERMHEQLSERAQYILQFATQVSHELKTPITAISGAVELLREQADEMSEAQRERFLRNMASDTERMDRLVRRLLQLARIESTTETAEPIDVAECLERMRMRDPERIRLDLASDLPTLRMQTEHFETAVGNLIDNALRHGSGHPIDIRVSRVEERAGSGDGLPEPAGRADRIRIEVRDRGPGIALVHRARIFERFYTTQRDLGGTGLGLALVRAVAEAHGGRIEFECTPGSTTFRLIL